MPRKAKPTPDEACALHLRDLRREHGRPPADVRPPESERFAGMTLLAVSAGLMSARATAPAQPPGSSRAATSFASSNRPSRY